MNDTIWKIKEKKEISQSIAEAAGSNLLAQLLVQRNIDTPEKIHDFFHPEKMKITSPFVFTDMEKSVERIFKAIETQEKILIYGDFDADGVTSTSLLYKTLTRLGANVMFYIPNRETENHGLNTKALVPLIAKQKVKLIITVDCGISNVEQVSFANSFKADVIITDHHEAPENLPEAFAIINPKAMNSLDKNLALEQIEALNQLAGVGVAFKLACALLEKKQDYDYAQELLPYVTVGTIADVVPILYENRAFVDAGLKLIENNKHYGIKKLLELSGCEVEKGVTSENIAFGVAPRINAAGRLDTVDNAVKLLISDNKTEIDVCAEELNNFNAIRQNLCDEIYNEAVEMLQSEPQQDCIVLYNPEWHIGIIGIVASKLVEKFYKPVFLMTKDKNTGAVRCSSRSIPEIHILNVITENAELFDSFGGHAQAAGLGFDSAVTKIETVKQALNATVKNMLNGAELKPSIEIDLELEPSEINMELMESLKKLEPYGEQNKPPMFASKNLVLESTRVMGAKANHLKFVCSGNGGNLECVYWNHNELNIPQGKTLDISFYPKINVFNGSTTIQLDIQGVKSEFAVKNEAAASELKLYDHRKKTDILSQISDYLLTTKVPTTVFAQEKKIVELLKPYNVIYEKIANRKNLKKCSQVMLFDFPACERILKEIKAKTGARIFHFMNYNNVKINPQELIKNISGMLKYVDSNKNGIFDLNDVSDYLSITDEITELCLDIVESVGMIEVISKQSNSYEIKFLHAVEFSKIKENEMYEELQAELAKVYDYRERLKTEALADLIK